MTAQSIQIQKPINGISFSGPQYESELDPKIFLGIVETNANWVGFVPEVILNRSTLKLRPDSENHWWGRTLIGNISAIKLAKEKGLKVMLKPQMVLDNVTSPSGLFSDLIKLEDLGGRIVDDKSDGASWRGEFRPDSEKDWLIWEASYRNYILKVSSLAQELGVDLLCIGTELKQSTKRRSEFWIKLIKEIREVYKGPITYSANWDEYSNIDFWNLLDYIGTNSYYPISLRSTPTVNGTKSNWRFFKRNLKKLSVKYDKEILITEFGYRNVSYAGVRPWIHDDGQSEPNYNAQSNLYEALFQAFWDESWIKGGFSWNWDAVEKEVGNTDFSIQNKPALKILTEWYSKSD